MTTGQQRRWQIEGTCLQSTATNERSHRKGEPAVLIERPSLVGWIARWLRDEEGVTAIEYGLLAALIAAVCVGAFQATGTSLGAMYTAWSAAVIDALTAAL